MRLLITVLLIASSMVVFAQPIHNTKTSFGFKAGASYSNMNFNKGVPAPPSPVATEWKPGVVAGCFINLRTKSDLSFQLEWLYSLNSSRRLDNSTTYHLQYLSFPLQLKYQPLKNFYLLAGPQFDLLIHASKNKLNGEDITHDTEERNVGISGGAEFLLTKRLSFSARYIHGLNHVGIGQRSNITEYKSRQAQATLNIYL